MPENRYRTMVEQAMEGILVVQGGRIVEANPCALRLFRATAEQVAAAHYLDFTFPGDRAMIEERYRRRAAGEDVPTHMVFRIQAFDGTPVWVESHRADIEWKGAPATLIFLTDFTRHKEAEAALQASLETLRMTQRVGHLGHWIWEPATDRMTLSEELLRILGTLGFPGVAREVTVRGFVESVFHPGDREALLAAARATAEGGRFEPMAFRLLPDGRADRWVELIPWERLQDPGGRVVRVVGLARDVTDQRRREEEKQKGQRLESLGMLAAGIAHDFNNLLTALFGSFEVALLKAGGRSMASADLRITREAFQRMKALTGRLLTFSKGGDPERRPVALERLVLEADRLALSGSGVACERAIPADLPPVLADEGQLAQVLHGVLMNARQAMPQGGTVRVRAAPREVSGDAEGPEAGLAPGRYVLVEIEDRGEGIAPEVLPKIFDPFFTTRELGSGLGLATAYSIVKRHGGRIWVESRRGEGTVVRFFLPAAPQAAAVPAPPAGPAGDPKKRVLVMDDDPMVRAVLRDMLDLLGFRMGEAGDGAAAVRAYGEALRSGARFDAVILDLTVAGGLGGRETLALLRRADPGLRAVVSSGYAEDPVLADPVGHGFRAAVTKPCRLEDLAAALEAALRPGA